jgi:H+/Cl- antiporter ClcA
VNDQPQTSELARAVQEVTERAQLLVREEIELAKAEVFTKAGKLAKGAAIGAAAGIFLLFGLIYFVHAVSWFVWDQTADKLQNESYDDYWFGYAVVAGAIFLVGILAGLIAARLFKKGSPPTPQMAIEEAQLIRQTVSGDTPTPARRESR